MLLPEQYQFTRGADKLPRRRCRRRRKWLTRPLHRRALSLFLWSKPIISLSAFAKKLENSNWPKPKESAQISICLIDFRALSLSLSLPLSHTCFYIEPRRDPCTKPALQPTHFVAVAVVVVAQTKIERPLSFARAKPNFRPQRPNLHMGSLNASLVRLSQIEREMSAAAATTEKKAVQKGASIGNEQEDRASHFRRRAKQRTAAASTPTVCLSVRVPVKRDPLEQPKH